MVENDEQLPFFGCYSVTDGDDGFIKPRRTATPTPRAATLGDFMGAPLKNKFDVMAEHEDSSPTTPTSSTPSCAGGWALRYEERKLR